MSGGRFPEAIASNDKFVHSVQELQEHMISFELPSQYQIKVGKFNYFWSTERITVDGGGKVEQRGIEAFIDFVKLKELPRTSTLAHCSFNSATKPSRQQEPVQNEPADPLLNDTPPWE